MDRTLTRCLRETAEPFQIARLPGRDTLSHSLMLREEMLSPASKPRWHLIPMYLVHIL